MIEKQLAQLITTLSSPENLPVVITLLVMIQVVGVCLAVRVMISQASQERRLDMHADHFDVLDDTHIQSLRLASDALKMAADAKAGRNIKDEDICAFINAQHVIESALREIDERRQE